LAYDGGNNTRQVCGFRGFARKLLHVPANCFQLPGKAIATGGVIPAQREQLIYQARNNIRAKRKPRRRVLLLLPLEPSALEEWLMTENVRRRPNLTE
jgi:hypothetical protein